MINWHEVDTVLLDMDGTLLDLNYDCHFWTEHLPSRYAQEMDATIEDARAKIFTMIANLQGTLNWYCLEYWSEQLSMDIPKLKAETSHLIKERPHTLAFLAWLKNAGKTTVLVTNSHEAGLKLKLKNSDIGQYLDHSYTSHQFLEPKESADFWLKFHEAFPFDLKKSVLIDDNEQVLSAAEKFGVQYLLTIRQPNLAQPPRQDVIYPAIDCYQALIQ